MFRVIHSLQYLLGLLSCCLKENRALLVCTKHSIITKSNLNQQNWNIGNVCSLESDLFQENGRRQHPGVTYQSIATAFPDTQDDWKYPEFAHAKTFSQMKSIFQYIAIVIWVFIPGGINFLLKVVKLNVYRSFHLEAFVCHL